MIGLVFHITSEDMSATIGHKCNGTEGCNLVPRVLSLIFFYWREDPENEVAKDGDSGEERLGKSEYM